MEWIEDSLKDVRRFEESLHCWLWQPRVGGGGWYAMERALANGNYYREEREDKRRKKQPALFEPLGHSYQVIVTNIEEMSPEELWRFYNGRAAVE